MGVWGWSGGAASLPRTPQKNPPGSFSAGGAPGLPGRNRAPCSPRPAPNSPFGFNSELRAKWGCEEFGDTGLSPPGRRPLGGRGETTRARPEGPLGAAHAFRLIQRPSFVTANMSQWLRINYRSLYNENTPLLWQRPAGE